MIISDVLRKLADLTDAIGDVQSDNSTSPNGTTESGNDKGPEGVFLPPLQQKQELLKKAVGVDNVYDDGTASDQVEAEQTTEQEESDDERLKIMNRIRQLSGLPTAAIFSLTDNDPLDS